jgi:hypothetical protein
MSHAQNTFALQSNVFLNGIHRLLVTSERRSAKIIAKVLSVSLQCKVKVRLPCVVSLEILSHALVTMALNGNA